MVSHPQVVVEQGLEIPPDNYHFYVLEDPILLDKIERIKGNSPIYFSERTCSLSVPIRKVAKRNVMGCLEGRGVKEFVDKVKILRQQKAKINEASCVLDSLKIGDFKTLARQMKKKMDQEGMLEAMDQIH